jgi:hypothetical protein
MALKHPDGPGRQEGENDWPPLFGLEPGRLPATVFASW